MVVRVDRDAAELGRAVAVEHAVGTAVAVGREDVRGRADQPRARRSRVDADRGRDRDRAVRPAERDRAAGTGRRARRCRRPCGRPRRARSVPALRGIVVEQQRIRRPFASTIEAVTRSACRRPNERAARRPWGIRRPARGHAGSCGVATGERSSFSRSATANAAALPTSRQRTTRGEHDRPNAG